MSLFKLIKWTPPPPALFNDSSERRRRRHQRYTKPSKQTKKKSGTISLLTVPSQRFCALALQNIDGNIVKKIVQSSILYLSIKIP